MVQEVVRSVENNRNRLYPDPEAAVLTDAIAKYYNVDSNQVFVGVGSDDVIGMSFLTFFNSEKPILFPDITYSFYDVWADLFKIKYEMKPLNEKFEIVKEDYLVENGGIIFPNPNAPTAVEMQLDDIEYIIKNNRDSVVIIDEAYADFGDVSVLGLVNKYENLLVVQTLSKSRALAGMRVGFAAGSKELIEGMDRVKNSFNSYPLIRIAIACAAASLEDESYFCQTVEKIMATRRRTAENLEKMGFTVLDSKANFLFVSHPNFRADMLFHALTQRGILVRYFNLS